MDPDLSIPDIQQDILLPQEFALKGYSRSLMRNPFYASHQKKKRNASIYESKESPESLLELHRVPGKVIRNRPISSLHDRADIDAQKVFKLTSDFLEENGLAERLLKPGVDLENILAEGNDDIPDMDNAGIVQEQTIVRFEEQDHQILHDRFMKQVRNVIHRTGSRPHTSESGTLYRPTTASTRRSATPSGKGLQSKKDDNETVVEGNLSRPQTGGTLQNLPKGPTRSNKQVKQTSVIERAKVVVDFLQTSPLLTGYRSKGSKSLADWRMIKKTEEQIWDSNEFSVQDFMRDYVKMRDLAVEKNKSSVSQPEESAFDKTDVGVQEKADSDKVKKRISIIQSESNRRKSIAKRASIVSKESRRTSNTSKAFITPSSQLRGSMMKRGSIMARSSMKGGGLIMPLKPTTDVEIHKYTEQHPECGNILDKIPLDRSTAEKNLLFKMFRDFKAFRKLSDFTLGEVVGALVLQEYEADRAIFKQGDLGTAWYIILSGVVSVQVSRTGRIEDSFEVVKLKEGDGFGDLALVNDEPRAATVLSKEFCQLVYIDRTDFNRIVKFSYEKEMKEKILFLKKFPLLADFSFAALKSVAQVMEWKKFLPGAHVLKEGEKSKNFCIVRSGEAVVTRSIKIPGKENVIQVVIGQLGRHDYFGEEGVYALDSDASNLGSNEIPSSIIAAKNTKELEIGVIACFDAKNKINHIPKNPVHKKSVGEIIRIYHEGKLKKKWDRQKKIFFDKMLQEKFIDPNINTDKWKRMSSKKKTPWIL